MKNLFLDRLTKNNSKLTTKKSQTTITKPLFTKTQAKFHFHSNFLKLFFIIPNIISDNLFQALSYKPIWYLDFLLR